MTHEVTINLLEKIKAHNEEMAKDYSGGWEGDVEAVEIAIEAVKKQMPKKALIMEYRNGTPHIFECRCGSAPRFTWREFDFCPKCGQRFDWR